MSSSTSASAPGVSASVEFSRDGAGEPSTLTGSKLEDVSAVAAAAAAVAAAAVAVAGGCLEEIMGVAVAVVVVVVVLLALVLLLLFEGPLTAANEDSMGGNDAASLSTETSMTSLCRTYNVDLLSTSHLTKRQRRGSSGRETKGEEKRGVE